MINHERESNEVIASSVVLVPGVLQTPDYTCLVTEAGPIEKKDVPKIAAARLARAEILRPGRTFTFYVHENALLLPVGGEEVWREQLAHLLRVSVRQYVVFLDTLNCGLFVDDKQTIALYEERVKRLAAVALDRDNRGR
ncbi:DUF5753 domain-containing protein [Lentzea sp. JNUCC 0626]|uniref:DUF5753 domain-containing protein n=1 Tax=Lentzea sp. JNUCC 0626 TaxID=3367513 RepID=UPI003749981B